MKRYLHLVPVITTTAPRSCITDFGLLTGRPALGEDAARFY
jgi:hypothetical protein